MGRCLEQGGAKTKMGMDAWGRVWGCGLLIWSRGGGSRRPAAVGLEDVGFTKSKGNREGKRWGGDAASWRLSFMIEKNGAARGGARQRPEIKRRRRLHREEGDKEPAGLRWAILAS
jgi:hypothetical protein